MELTFNIMLRRKRGGGSVSICTVKFLSAFFILFIHTHFTQVSSTFHLASLGNTSYFNKLDFILLK